MLTIMIFSLHQYHRVATGVFPACMQPPGTKPGFFIKRYLTKKYYRCCGCGSKKQQ